MTAKLQNHVCLAIKLFFLIPMSFHFFFDLRINACFFTINFTFFFFLISHQCSYVIVRTQQTKHFVMSVTTFICTGNCIVFELFISA